MYYFYNFKGFKEATVDLFQPLTVLIGPNGSGKTNVIEGMEVFSFIAHGRPLHEIVDIGRTSRTRSDLLEVRGGVQACPTYGEEIFIFQFSASIRFQGRSRPFMYSIEVRVSPEPHISGEILTFKGGPNIFQTIGPPSITSGGATAQFNNFARGGKKPRASVSCHRSVLSQYKEFARRNKKYDACIRVVDGIMHYLRRSFVFDPEPKLMRTYERIGNNILTRNGANLSSVLYSLYKGKKEDQETLDRLLGWISQLPEEPYKEFGFVTTDLNDVILGFRHSNGRPLVDARVLSDGTLRCLAVLTALETVAPSSRVVVEEFDNGLHPSRAHVLLEAMKSCCERRDLNVLVTTHNPATLNALKPDQLEGIVLCSWDNEEKCFKLTRLCDLPRYDELLERGRLGDLITRRVVEQYLGPKFEEEHMKKALDWMKDLP